MNNNETVFINVPIEKLSDTLALKLFEKISKAFPPPPKKEIVYLTRKETANLLKITPPTVDTYTDEKLLKKYGTGIRGRYIKDEVEAAREVIYSKKYKKRLKSITAM